MGYTAPEVELVPRVAFHGNQPINPDNFPAEPESTYSINDPEVLAQMIRLADFTMGNPGGQIGRPIGAGFLTPRYNSQSYRRGMPARRGALRASPYPLMDRDRSVGNQSYASVVQNTPESSSSSDDRTPVKSPEEKLLPEVVNYREVLEVSSLIKFV